ncbi:MAG: DUF1616 domain-containing protein [Thermoplasmata archaeon]|nr:DUF1616 domain-containing protein [Thermoplasmata archaeon]MCI4359158.1 DUF1616 domain-containing protein [Thermoplasmata archaeon]
MTETWEVIVGLLLLFLLPGFGVTRALFPERRVFRPVSLKNLLEQLTSSIVLSVAITILVAFAWLGTPIGVQAGWSDPLVEETLGAVTAVAFGVAAFRGSFARVPPPARRTESGTGGSDPMVLIRRLDELARSERSLKHRIRTAGADAVRSAPWVEELARIQAEAAQLRAKREEEYASA